MRILIDMNLSPEWVKFFEQNKVQSTHWSEVGEANASDEDIFNWAREHGAWIFTHDLDFGAILAVGGESGPSVIQVRVEDLDPDRLGRDVLLLLKQFNVVLQKGALVVLDDNKTRVRILPLKPENFSKEES